LLFHKHFGEKVQIKAVATTHRLVRIIVKNKLNTTKTT